MTYLDLHCRVKEREVVLVKGMVFANRLSSSQFCRIPEQRIHLKEIVVQMMTKERSRSG
jgi:hypothetical protein